MKRILKTIDHRKWYHLETLKKFYNNYKIECIEQNDAEGKQFTFVIFKYLWREHAYMMHPKTKRIKFLTNEVYNEVNYVI